MQDHQGHDLLDSPANPQAETAEPQLPRADAPVPAGGGAKPDVDLAHDFSNFAMTIVSAANLLQRFSQDPERVAQIAKLLRETGERAVAISRRLRP